MSMFNKKNRKAIKIIWAVISLLVILSMIVLYFPSLTAQ